MSAMLTLLIDRVQTPTGTMWLVTDEQHRVRALQWDEGPLRAGLTRRHSALTLKAGRAPRVVTDALVAYFAGEMHALDTLAVEAAGTKFQRAVWSALRTIKVGTTCSYGDIARQIGNPKAVRAVGLANGQNPIGIVVPCHRVIGANGALTGYGGGMPRKQWLLRHEGAIA